MSLPPDIKKYRKYVDRFDLSEEQKVELIHTVWQIVENFAHRAFGLDPVQQAIGSPNAEDAGRRAPVLEFGRTPDTANPVTCAFRQDAEAYERRKKQTPCAKSQP